MICTKCGRDLPENDFNYRNKEAGTLRRECKECNRKLQYVIYHRNKDFIDAWKSQGCQKCGEKRIYLIDAHHRDPQEKDKDICKLKINASIERIQQELNKCVQLCANCHREFHYLENYLKITINEYLHS